MPWMLFSLALAATFLVQTAAMHLAAPRWLDLLLTLALICGLMAPVTEGRLAGWITGLAYDIGGAGPLGLHALALGLAVVIVGSLRDMVNRSLWWVRWLIAAVAALPAQLLVELHFKYYQGASISWSQVLLGSAAAALLAAWFAGLPVYSNRRTRHAVMRR